MKIGFLIFDGFPMSCLTSLIEPLRAANEISKTQSVRSQQCCQCLKCPFGPQVKNTLFAHQQCLETSFLLLHQTTAWNVQLFIFAFEPETPNNGWLWARLLSHIHKWQVASCACRETLHLCERDAVSVSKFQCAGALNLGVRKNVRDGMREWYARECARRVEVCDLNYFRTQPLPTAL